MIAVIFEVIPHAEKVDAYLNTAASLRPLLEQVAGFISVERFESLSQPGKLLSLSFWRDSDAVQNWRCTELHQHAQAQGRSSIFADYRIRVAQVMRDYGLNEREQAPTDTLQFHQEIHHARP